MSCQYTCVAYKKVLLAHRGKTDKIEKERESTLDLILSTFAEKDNVRSSQDLADSTMYVVLKKQITYIAWCDKSVAKNQAYGMLEDVSESFQAKYELAKAINAANK